MSFIKKFILLLFFCTNLLSDSPEKAVKTIVDVLNSIKTLKSDIILNDSLNGTLYYKSPKQIHIKLSDGRIIASNGRFLWFYSPYNNIVGKQPLEENSTHSLKDLFLRYKKIETVEKNKFKLSLNSKAYKEIIFSMDENLKFLRLLILKKSETNNTKIIFSNVKLNLGLTSNLFNFNPSAESQVVINPLNY